MLYAESVQCQKLLHAGNGPGDGAINLWHTATPNHFALRMTTTSSLNICKLAKQLSCPQGIFVVFYKLIPYHSVISSYQCYNSYNALVCATACLYHNLYYLLQALDLLFQKMQAAGFPFSQVVAMSGCGQQHSSVYWKERSENTLKNLNPQLSLESSLKVLSAIISGEAVKLAI